MKLRYSIIAANYAFVRVTFEPRRGPQSPLSLSFSSPTPPAAPRTSRITRLVNAFTCPSRTQPVVVSVYPPLESISRFVSSPLIVFRRLALTERPSYLVLVRRAIEIDRIELDDSCKEGRLNEFHCFLRPFSSTKVCAVIWTGQTHARGLMNVFVDALG